MARLMRLVVELFQANGKFCHTTPCIVRVPGGNRGYTACWPREPVLPLGSDRIPAAEG